MAHVMVLRAYVLLSFFLYLGVIVILFADGWKRNGDCLYRVRNLQKQIQNSF
jgi:hypothetical protein